MPNAGGRENHAEKTAAAPAIKPLTLTRTEKPRKPKAIQAARFFSFPVKSSFSKHLINCAPLLLQDSSAIMKCMTRLIRYAKRTIHIKSCQRLREAKNGTARIPEPTPCPTMILVASIKVSLDSLVISLIIFLIPEHFCSRIIKISDLRFLFTAPCFVVY